MSDTTTLDPSATTTIDPGITTTVDPGITTTAVDPGVTPTQPTDAGVAPTTPVNEAIPTENVATPVNPATIVTSSPFLNPTFPSNTIVTSNSNRPSSFLTSIRPSQTNGPPFSGPPPFVTAGGRPPFASGSGPPFFDNDRADQLSTGAKAGIGVGVIALVFSVAAVVLLIWRMKKRERQNFASPTDEPLPTYTESNPQNSPPNGGAPAMAMLPKSAMKKVAPSPLLLDLHGSGSNTPVYGGASTERRRSYVMEGTEKPMVLSIWEPANRSSTSSLTSSPVLAPVPPPKAHRKSNPGARPRRKSNLAPVSEEMPESSTRLALVRDDGSSSSGPPTPRTPRSAAFHALNGDSASGQNSPMNSSFTLDPVPPLPETPTSSNFEGKK